jgi:predicted phosphodiesterase
MDEARRPSRRVFLKAAGAAALAAFPRVGRGQRMGPALTFGIVTDCHAADLDPRGNRYYRESGKKLAECVGEMNSRGVDFLIELGDFKDAGATAEVTLDYLHEIEGVFRGFKGPRYHVLGNHDMDRISKAQYLGQIQNTGIPAGDTFYSFDVKGFHFVVLDANFKADGADYNAGNFMWTEAYVPPRELAWLAADLEKASRPAVVFTHQLLDGDEGAAYVRNAAEVRRVLEASRRVRAVFQGHHHAGAYQVKNGIHYYTLKAVVEGTGPGNSAYAVVSHAPGGALAVQGFHRAESRRL